MRQTKIILAVTWAGTALFLSALMLGPGGCEKRQELVDTQPQPAPMDKEDPLNEQFDLSATNADMADMAVCDVDFWPNRAQLNGTGTAKLNRLAWIVDHYGGTVMVDLVEPNTQLARDRVGMVKTYLRTWGLSDEKIQVALGLPPTRGMNADEAIVIHKDTRYKPKEQKK